MKRSYGKSAGSSRPSGRLRPVNPGWDAAPPVDARNRLSGLAIPQEPPAATLVGPPDELSCPNDNIGVADSGGSYDAVGHPELDQASANLSCDRGRDWDLYPIVILTDCEDR